MLDLNHGHEGFLSIKPPDPEGATQGRSVVLHDKSIVSMDIHPTCDWSTDWFTYQNKQLAITNYNLQEYQ